MLGDTGAQVSLIADPVKGIPLRPSNRQLYGITGTQRAGGEQELTVRYGKIELVHRFMVFPLGELGLDGILGVDLLLRLGPAALRDIGQQIGIDLSPKPQVPTPPLVNPTTQTQSEDNRPIPVGRVATTSWMERLLGSIRQWETTRPPPRRLRASYSTPTVHPEEAQNPERNPRESGGQTATSTEHKKKRRPRKKAKKMRGVPAGQKAQEKGEAYTTGSTKEKQQGVVPRTMEAEHRPKPAGPDALTNTPPTTSVTAPSKPEGWHHARATPHVSRARNSTQGDNQVKVQPMNEWMDDLDTHLDTMDHQYPTGVMPGGEDKEEKELFIGPKTPAGPGRRGDIKLRKQKAASKAPRQFTALEEMETEDESEPEHQPEGGSDSDGEPRVEAGEESITEESSGEEEQEGARHHYDDLRRLAEVRLDPMSGNTPYGDATPPTPEIPYWETDPRSLGPRPPTPGTPTPRTPNAAPRRPQRQRKLPRRLLDYHLEDHDSE
ncbi:hypothetical protein GE061_015856 [Apolygus lucorum]|uniref:Peptidase A2 domain-containing protein n=1 Tax=Apolygus lucorum TaxID=248454 RepID=A0A8S9XM56_APOLU|nr:hypothetical protein GE061_015856 [Apolygus lucorum]